MVIDPVAPVFWTVKWKEGAHSELKTSLSYILKFCLQQTKPHKNYIGVRKMSQWKNVISFPG